METFVKKVYATYNPSQLMHHLDLLIVKHLSEFNILQNWASPLVDRFGETPNDTLNNDLEDFFEDLCLENDKKGITETPIERKLVLYKMLEDDFLFMKSNCERLTVNLK